MSDFSECVSWLVRVGLINPDHKANSEQATVKDLVLLLRDGVNLCKLALLLSPECLDLKEISQRPQMAQFLCLRNIRTFLQICRSEFLLKESELFQPQELFDLTDFSKVLHCLSKLSCSQKAGRVCIGFVSSQEYRLNEELIEDRATANEANRVPEQSREEECIYEELCYINFQVKEKQPVTLKEGRDYVKSELLETETNYVEALNMLKKKFLRPLSSVLKDEEKAIVFFGVQELAEVHSGFLSDLNRLIQKSQSSHKNLGELFQHWRDRFVIYGDYCANLTRAQSTIEELNNRDGVREEIKKCERESNGGRFKLRDLLSVPMQRILKYPLLLKNLLDQTKIELHGYDEFKCVEKAHSIMADVAEFTNEVKRDSETLCILRQIEGSIYDLRMPTGMQLQDYGRLQKDGEVKIKSHEDHRLKPRYVFIFDKVMLMCKASRAEQYSYKTSICLQEYRLEDSSEPLKKSFAFNLVHNQDKLVFTLVTGTETEKKRWMRAVEEALFNISPPHSTSHIYTMHTFPQGSSCTNCQKFLKGLFYQGYKCLKCSCHVHLNCIHHSVHCGAGSGSSTPPSLPPRPLLQLPNGSSLEAYNWYGGVLTRLEAEELLDDGEEGVYLVRARIENDETSYAVSLRWSDGVKHMKILHNNNLFYLSESRYFKSVVELVHWYSLNSLSESFSGLDACLETPFEKAV